MKRLASRESGPAPLAQFLPVVEQARGAPVGFDGGGGGGALVEGAPASAHVRLVPRCRPLRRSSTSGSAGSCGPIAAASSWMLPTCGGSDTRASGRLPATPASLTTVRSSPCGSSPMWSGARVRAGSGGPASPCGSRVCCYHSSAHVATRVNMGKG